MIHESSLQNVLMFKGNTTQVHLHFKFHLLLLKPKPRVAIAFIPFWALVNEGMIFTIVDFLRLRKKLKA